MKTIRRKKDIEQATNAMAARLVRDNGWNYCPKWMALPPGPDQDRKRGTIWNKRR